ncbi:MAG: hypothetical protein A2Z99_12350 [Treponema sp. GWB1_62_6]|nr:MAG: hypothetical protein A2001_10260 [Treponema sp. GWC1_61_84]OHE65739.1 MAG: hypothetical protein A2Z99_12350 [Treponema sp. GWB1_62_6]HCM27706.1 hypothetical protein [Treponema sp.]
MNAAGFRDIALMSLRNLSRHKTKTVITTIAVAVSVALYIFMDSWLLGMNLDSRRNIVSYEIGAAKIQSAAYFAKKDELPMYESFSGWEKIADALAEEGYDSAPRFVFSGTLYSRSGTAPMEFNAVDVPREEQLLRYVPFMESGRFPRPGALELAVGTLAAEKLRIGIPNRPTIQEFGELVDAAATEDEAAFVRSLYGPAPVPKKGKKGLFANNDSVKLARDASRLALRKDATREELDRFWSILAVSGRMDVRISTTIDLKAAPETISKSKFEKELLPSLSDAAHSRIGAAYAQDPVTGDYYLAATDEAALKVVLADLVAADFSGAVRHVNQLIDAVVVGVVNSPNPKTNGNVAFVPLDALQDEAGLMLEGRVTELLVRKAGADDSSLPGKDESAETIAASLGPRLPEGMAAHGWLDYVADYIAASNGDNVSTRVMIFFLFLLSFIGIANTMLMAILERTKETGMLRALGMTDGQILLAYVIEAGLIGAIGSVAGVIVGCLINIPMVEYGVDYSAVAAEMGGDFGYRIATLFKSAWNPASIALTGFAAILLSAAAAILPTLRALRMPVTESLRFE